MTAPERRQRGRGDAARRACATCSASPRRASPRFDEATPLFGALPEFDSMAVAGLLTELEERLGILIEDHEVDADMMESSAPCSPSPAPRRCGERRPASPTPASRAAAGTNG